jgi:hypothetical protein
MDEAIALRLMRDLQRDFPNVMTAERAAGVVGALSHESGGFQRLQESQPAGAPFVPGATGGWGYAQWTGQRDGQRRRQFEDWVRANNLDPASYNANYGYLRREFNTPFFGRWMRDSLAGTQTAEEAARDFTGSADSGSGFLRPGIPRHESRIAQGDAARNLWNNRDKNPAWQNLLGYENYVGEPFQYTPPDRSFDHLDGDVKGSGYGNTFTLAGMGLGDFRDDVAGYDTAGNAYGYDGNLLPDPDARVNDAFVQFAKGGGNTGTGLRYDPQTGAYVPNTDGSRTDPYGENRYKDGTIFQAPDGSDWSSPEEWYLRNFEPASTELKLGGKFYREIDSSGIDSFGGFDTSTGLLKEPEGGWTDAREMFLRNYDPDNTIFDLGGKYYREPSANADMHWGMPTPQGGWASPEEKAVRNNEPNSARLQLGGDFYREIDPSGIGAFGFNPTTGLLNAPTGGWNGPQEQYLRNYDPGNAALQRGGQFFRDLPQPNFGMGTPTSTNPFGFSNLNTSAGVESATFGDFGMNPIGSSAPTNLVTPQTSGGTASVNLGGGTVGNLGFGSFGIAPIAGESGMNQDYAAGVTPTPGYTIQPGTAAATFGGGLTSQDAATQFENYQQLQARLARDAATYEAGLNALPSSPQNYQNQIVDPYSGNFGGHLAPPPMW